MAEGQVAASMLDLAAKLALGPVLLYQGRRVRRTALELPEPAGPRRGVEGSGVPALRLLVAGDSSAAGVGARTQDAALAKPLARALTAHGWQAVHWQLVARSGLTTGELLHALMHGSVHAADVAVIVSGVNDVTRQVAPARAQRQRAALVAWLRTHAAVQRVVFAALPPMEHFPALPQPLAWFLGRHAQRHNAALARWAAAQRDCSFLAPFGALDGAATTDLFCADGFHPAPLLYARVAQLMAAHIVTVMPASRASNSHTREAA